VVGYDLHSLVQEGFEDLAFPFQTFNPCTNLLLLLKRLVS